MCIGAGETQAEQGSEMFFGSIKSFNTRRGFGFLSCEATAQLYGRDVYLSKDEAMTLAIAPSVGVTAPENDKAKTAPVQEGDFLSFVVKLSMEGFPQAEQVRKIRRLRGVVSKSPSVAADGIIVVTGDDGAKADSDVLGVDVRLPPSACGQLQLMPDDEVAFCCSNSSQVDGQVLEAHRIELVKTSRVAGSVLGCFSLKLPRPATKNASDGDDGASTAASSEDSPDVELHGYALTDRVYVAESDRLASNVRWSEMPADLSVSDLMRLFGKIGGQAATVTSADDNFMSGSTCITFSTTEQVAKFLSQATHTISESGVAQIAQVGPCFHRQCGSSCRFCASQTSTSPSAREVSFGNVDTVLQMQPEITKPVSQMYASEITCVPCGAASADGQMMDSSAASLRLDAEAQAQHAASSLSAPVPNMPMRSSLPDWRCIHGSIVIAAAAPEMVALGENGSSLHLQWPTVVHASAYVVELVDQCTGASQQFVRPANTDANRWQVLTDLRVDGLRPGSYAARVRCVAACGCESTCSDWAVLPFAWAPASNMLPPSAPASVPAGFRDLCPPPPSAAPSYPVVSAVAASGLPTILEDAADASRMCNDEVLLLD